MWILFMLILSQGHVTVTTQTFTHKEACVFSQQEIEDHLPKRLLGNVRLFCIEDSAQPEMDEYRIP